MYIPRERDELARIFLGALISRSELTDTAPGSVIDVLAQSMAALASSTEYRIARMRDAFNFETATGAELDARLSEFPPSSIERHEATYAQGEVRVTLPPLGVDLTIDQGASFGASANPDILFSAIDQTVIPAGATSATFSVVANVLGVAGNIGGDRINVIINAPSQLLSVTNPNAFSNGREEESDQSLKRRASLYLQSLARAQPRALEFAALSADLTPRLSLASLYEPPDQRGYSWLYIDDGSGTLGDTTSPGTRYTGVGSAQGPSVIYHDSPAVNSLTLSYIDPVTGLSRPVSTADYISIPERGVIYLDANAIPDTAQWTLDAYEVFTGPIATIQALIEGDPADPNAQGWRAAGTRVRVYPPNVQRLSFDLHLVPESGYSFETTKQAVEAAVIDYLSILRIGDPVYVARLIEIIMSVQGVLNIDIYQSGTGSSDSPTPLADLYPSANAVVRLSTISISPSEA